VGDAMMFEQQLKTFKEHLHPINLDNAIDLEHTYPELTSALGSISASMSNLLDTTAIDSMKIKMDEFGKICTEAISNDSDLSKKD